MHHTKAGRRPHTPKQRPAIYLSNTALKSAGSASSKTQVLACKARDADVYWSTLGIAERSASGSAPTKTRVLTRKAHGADVYWST